jgi:hypothetical protein
MLSTIDPCTDLGLNPYIPTEEFLSYLDNPEFLGMA